MLNSICIHAFVEDNTIYRIYGNDIQSVGSTSIRVIVILIRFVFTRHFILYPAPLNSQILYPRSWGMFDRMVACTCRLQLDDHHNNEKQKKKLMHCKYCKISLWLDDPILISLTPHTIHYRLPKHTRAHVRSIGYMSVR